MATMVAGKIGATISKRSRLLSISPSTPHLFNNTAPPRRPSHLPFPVHTIFDTPRRCISSAAMAAVEPCRESLPINDPSPKIQKLAQKTFSHALSAAPPLLLRVKKLSQSAVLPSRASPFSAGYDLSSAKDLKIPARGKVLVPTDLSISIPEGTYARIAPRSGLALKHSIDVGAGVVDADYRGPVGVILFNHSDADFEVKAGDRIAQLILEKIATPDVTEVQDLDSTDRGDGGFGSTGV